MNNNLTELVFILDRSGSMYNLVSDTIGGFNATLASQKTGPGDALVTTVLFDDKVELLHDRIPIQGISPITEREYYVRGCTALLDAVGSTIQKITNAHRHTAEELRPGKTLFVIITDGMENASREYDLHQVRRLITRQQEEHHWEFLFLGANIDAVRTAGSMGIAPECAADYMPDSEGTAIAYEAFNVRICEQRSCAEPCAPRSSAWKQKVASDHRKRSRR